MLKRFIILTGIILSATSGAFAQKVVFISSDVIREKIPELQQAEQRIHSFVDERTKEITSYQKQIEDLEVEIKKNKLVWSDAEKIRKDKDLANLRSNLDAFYKHIFYPGGEYDKVFSHIMKPIEGKISLLLNFDYYFFIVNLLFSY
ncbi:MAG: OmpH family outer membrane protein [Chloroflexota bacterium]